MVFNDANRVLRPVPHVGVGEVQGLLSGIERIIKFPWVRVPAFDFEDEERLRAVICGTFHSLLLYPKLNNLVSLRVVENRRPPPSPFQKATNHWKRCWYLDFVPGLCKSIPEKAKAPVAGVGGDKARQDNNVAVLPDVGSRRPPIPGEIPRHIFSWGIDPIAKSAQLILLQNGGGVSSQGNRPGVDLSVRGTAFPPQILPRNVGLTHKPRVHGL